MFNSIQVIVPLENTVQTVNSLLGNCQDSQLTGLDWNDQAHVQWNFYLLQKKHLAYDLASGERTAIYIQRTFSLTLRCPLLGGSTLQLQRRFWTYLTIFLLVISSSSLLANCSWYSPMPIMLLICMFNVFSSFDSTFFCSTVKRPFSPRSCSFSCRHNWATVDVWLVVASG